MHSKEKQKQRRIDSVNALQREAEKRQQEAVKSNRLESIIEKSFSNNT